MPDEDPDEDLANEAESTSVENYESDHGPVSALSSPNGSPPVSALSSPNGSPPGSVNSMADSNKWTISYKRGTTGDSEVTANGLCNRRRMVRSDALPSALPSALPPPNNLFSTPPPVNPVPSEDNAAPSEENVPLMVLKVLFGRQLKKGDVRKLLTNGGILEKMQSMAVRSVQNSSQHKGRYSETAPYDAFQELGADMRDISHFSPVFELLVSCMEKELRLVPPGYENVKRALEAVDLHNGEISIDAMKRHEDFALLYGLLRLRDEHFESSFHAYEFTTPLNIYVTDGVDGTIVSSIEANDPPDELIGSKLLYIKFDAEEPTPCYGLPAKTVQEMIKKEVTGPDMPIVIWCVGTKEMCETWTRYQRALNQKSGEVIEEHYKLEYLHAYNNAVTRYNFHERNMDPLTKTNVTPSAQPHSEFTDVVTSHEDKRTQGAVKDSCKKQIQSVRACIDRWENNDQEWVYHARQLAKEQSVFAAETDSVAASLAVQLLILNMVTSSLPEGLCVHDAEGLCVHAHPESKIFLESIFMNGVHADDGLRGKPHLYTRTYGIEEPVYNLAIPSHLDVFRIHHIQPIRDHVCAMIRQLMIKHDTTIPGALSLVSLLQERNVNKGMEDDQIFNVIDKLITSTRDHFFDATHGVLSLFLSLQHKCRGYFSTASIMKRYGEDTATEVVQARSFLAGDVPRLYLHKDALRKANEANKEANKAEAKLWNMNIYDPGNVFSELALKRKATTELVSMKQKKQKKKKSNGAGSSSEPLPLPLPLPPGAVGANDNMPIAQGHPEWLPDAYRHVGFLRVHEGNRH